MENKFKLKKERFINWYFSDNDIKIDFANKLVGDLEDQGSSDVTIQGILDTCFYIPQWLCEGQSSDDNEDLDPEDVELI
jgi:hypothetical protein